MLDVLKKNTFKCEKVPMQQKYFNKAKGATKSMKIKGTGLWGGGRGAVNPPERKACNYNFPSKQTGKFQSGHLSTFVL